MATRRGVGRPAEGNSEATRLAILASAKRAFALQGYAATTLKGVAEDAGLTQGTVYFYYRSKAHLFLAVDEVVSDGLLSRLRDAASKGSTLAEKWGAVLDACVALAEEDPVLVQYSANVRTEARRHPEIAEVGHDRRFGDFLGEMVSAGVATGEVARRDATKTRLVLATALNGLTQASADLNFRHYRQVVEAYKQAFTTPFPAVTAG
jgi:AcrR family transcriptional regulator